MSEKKLALSKYFAIIGVAGYVAPRHMNAIKEMGGNLVAAVDPNDSVGILDNYFPDAQFFTEFERFDRHIDKLRRHKESAINYCSICSPNYLHDSHVRFTLRSNADAICEKPLVLNHWNIDGLQEIEKSTGCRVYTILQLRLHPAITVIKKKIKANRKDSKYDVDLTYVTSRGQWYQQSWKGDLKKSGGIATNIGIHFFDMLSFLFGSTQHLEVHYSSSSKASGYIEYENARVRWFMSIDIRDVPKHLRDSGQKTFRSITISGEEIEFSEGFADLHTKSYQEILSGNGFGLEENRAAIETVSKIRTERVVTKFKDQHPFLSRGLR